ncbi:MULTISPECIES: murein L,D-transpeptidase catalytic domain family protein [Myroides]|uniref:Murein L,D-transpeptidase catalytic domain family protein n=1 Tax=Myroides albus TaxID=2562892 RepID=A0A6I3LFJ5_9FLAO|nr:MULTISPECIES: murein L,D-transpeptidase catalytic domain family protein [Myroides]MTG96933.1 hypothetical protein [Myroides albus]MVX35374.1 hypothetical protein [Myroides sp. LoEW2-1]UVD78316.1 murein L,D-transpeptidase catalytic domain family protein [Myroides albus]
MRTKFIALFVLTFSIVGAGRTNYERNWTNVETINLVNEVDVANTRELEEIKSEDSFESLATSTYNSLTLNSYEAPSLKVFSTALRGYYKMVENGEILNTKLTIVDFSLSSSQQRLWVIDMDSNEVVLQSYVAHGKKTGDEYATAFSNRINSHMSSLGFYKTGETYTGRNGFSLRLDGVERGINDNARARAIVVHGADYASEDLVRAQGKLGRSYGCPAVPVEVNDTLIELIKGKSCLFIYHPNKDYQVKSRIV